MIKKATISITMTTVCIVLFAFASIHGWQIKEGHKIEFDNPDVFDGL